MRLNENDPSVPADRLDDEQDVWGSVGASSHAADHAPGEGAGITDYEDPAPADVLDADIKGFAPARSGSSLTVKILFGVVFLAVVGATAGGLWNLYRKFVPAQESVSRTGTERDVEVSSSADRPAPAVDQLAGQPGAAPGTTIGGPQAPASDGQLPAAASSPVPVASASTSPAIAPTAPPVIATPAPPQIDPAATAPNRQAEQQAAEAARKEAERADKAAKEEARESAKQAKAEAEQQKRAQRRLDRVAEVAASRARADQAGAPARQAVAKSEPARRSAAKVASPKAAPVDAETQASLGVVTAYRIESIHPRSGDHQMAWVRGNGKLRIVTVGDTIDGMRVLAVDASKFSVRTNQGEIR